MFLFSLQNSLEFPDDQPLSDDAKGLIRALLTDQKERITYSGLATHPFFTGLDWTTLQDGKIYVLKNKSEIEFMLKEFM